MKMKRNKKVLLIMGMLALLVIGSTFAYFQKSESIDNKFKSAEAKVNITEKFNLRINGFQAKRSKKKSALEMKGQLLQSCV